jgi:hypothetical protein
MGGQDGAKPMTNVNSTHWAVASINETGELTQAPKQSQVPKDELVVNAYSSGTEEHSQKALTEKTVEGFETVRGVPMLGVQWHPEGYLPGMTGENSGSAQSREQSRKIFEAMSKVALTSGQRRHALNQELGGEEAAFKRFCEAFGQYAKGNAEQGSLLYEQVAALLPKHLWSARLDELDRALKLLQKALVAEESDKNRLNEEVRVILADNGVK